MPNSQNVARFCFVSCFLCPIFFFFFAVVFLFTATQNMHFGRHTNAEVKLNHIHIDQHDCHNLVIVMLLSRDQFYNIFNWLGDRIGSEHCKSHSIKLRGFYAHKSEKCANDSNQPYKNTMKIEKSHFDSNKCSSSILKPIKRTMEKLSPKYTVEFKNSISKQNRKECTCERVFIAPNILVKCPINNIELNVAAVNVYFYTAMWKRTTKREVERESKRKR